MKPLILCMPLKQNELLHESDFDPVTMKLEKALSDYSVQPLALYPCIWASHFGEP